MFVDFDRHPNPWVRLDWSRDRRECIAFKAEYAQPIFSEHHDCPACPGQVWFRMTLQRFMCPDCRSVQNLAGEWVTAQGYTPEWEPTAEDLEELAIFDEGEQA